MGVAFYTRRIIAPNMRDKCDFILLRSCNCHLLLMILNFLISEMFVKQDEVSLMLQDELRFVSPFSLSLTHTTLLNKLN